MAIVSYSIARKNFRSLIDKVNNDSNASGVNKIFNLLI